ncbi:MAG TPA: hypothetical protein VG488_11395 [Candidatus Angelobacter sp.]|jgi:hypothetical protein|nr:hypothetical protein [Candidatus Angelobacter sp.]
MDHDLAIKNNAAERYLLGELTEVEIEEYEEHFFSCTACAQEVKLGSEFIDHAREVFKTDFKAETKLVAKMSTAWGRFWNSLRQPAPAFACALLALAGGFSLYQNSVIADLKKPDIVNTGMILRNARGPGDAPLWVGPKEPFNLRFDISSQEKFSAYEVQVLDSSRTVVFSRYVPAQQTSDHLQMTFRGGTLKQGEYNVVIRGISTGNADRPEIAKYSFALTLQN